MDQGIALPDSWQDFFSLTFANPISATAVAATITVPILAIFVRGNRSKMHRVTNTFADVVSFSATIPSVSAWRTTRGRCRELCSGGVTLGEHGDVASRAGRREEGNWRTIGVANHVGGDSMSDKLVFGGDNMIRKRKACAWLLQ